MTFEEFLSNNFAELVGLVFIWIILNKERVLEKDDVHHFMVIFYCEVIEMLAFNIEKITGYWAEPTAWRIILSAIAYTLRAVLVYLFIRLIWPYEHNKKARILLAIPLVICAICGISPFFTDIVYSFNSGNHFCRGPLGWIFMVTVIAYVLLFVFFIFKQHKNNGKMNTVILSLIAFFIITSTILSTIYDMEWMGRLSIVYGIVFCLFALDTNRLQKTIYALQENQELKEALKELEKTKKEAEVANEAKTTFLLNMSHDIRTPLNGIIGMLDIADRFPDDLNKQKDCREKVRNASKILLELVNDVLDRSKLESGEVVLEHVSFDVNDIVRDTYVSISKLAEDAGVEIIEEESSIEHFKLIGSPLHFKRILINIISNAIKYNKEHGKVYISLKEVSSNDGIAVIEFICRDTGIGMSEEFQKHLFEPFTQENHSARSNYSGTGLGMSIVKSIVDKMNGGITVQSVKDVGSTFDIIIPFEIDDSKKAMQEESEDEVKTYSITGINILLVEDNDLNMEIAEFLLKDKGANVIQAKNGQEAVEVFTKSKPQEIDVILMDVMMPIMNGYEATRTIRSLDREDAKDIPIIAMTANAFVEDKIKATEAGMNGYISKPLEENLVIQTIAKNITKAK